MKLINNYWTGFVRTNGSQLKGIIMKNTMNSRNVSKFHKMLKAEVSIGDCSKALNISKKTLESFTPDALSKKDKKTTSVASKPVATKGK